ncbi:hypothetical protein BD769DRAFT_1382603 [Suillus cothurnatus]|nr:hypothetical protein BD769DRAFT_1382603 [Suillus cothurnatus]
MIVTVTVLDPDIIESGHGNITVAIILGVRRVRVRTRLVRVESPGNQRRPLSTLPSDGPGWANAKFQPASGCHVCQWMPCLPVEQSCLLTEGNTLLSAAKQATRSAFSLFSRNLAQVVVGSSGRRIDSPPSRMLLVEASHASANLKFVTNLMDSTRRESSPRGTIAELTRMQDNGTASSMQVGRTKTMSPKRSSSRRHQEAREHVAAADKAISSAAKKRSTRRVSTTGDRIRPCSKGHSHADPFLGPPSYPPNAIIRRMARCTQIDSTYGTCAKPSGPTPGELTFAEKALAMDHSGSEISLINSEIVYEEASDEASWFERFLSDRSLAQVQQDFNLNLKVYNNDLSSFATTDGLLNEIENHAEERDLVLSQEEFAKKIKALMVERDGLKGDGEESHGETDDSSVVKIIGIVYQSPLPMASKKGKGKAKRVSPSPDDLQYTSGYCTNLDNPSQSSLDMDFNHASSSDASFGVQVPSMRQPYHDNHFPPSSNLSFTAAAPNSSFPPFSPYFDVSNPYLTSLNPNHDVVPPTLNLAPLNPVAASAPNIVAPHPRLPHDTTALELMVQSYREPLFLRHRTLEARTSVRSQPYNLTVRRGTSSNDISQARQVEFEGEASAIVWYVGDSETRREITPPSLDSGPFNTRSLHGSPSNSRTFDNGTFDSGTFNAENTSANTCDMRKSLRMVPVNLRNEIKRLARTIALCSWGLSPGLEEQIQDIVAYRRALVEALIQTYDHVDSSMAPFGHPAVVQMVQAIIRQFRCHLPENDDEINVANIIAFAVTMLRFALREFSEGTYNPSEFVVEDEETTYNEVLNRIEGLDESDLEFYYLMIDHIFKLL